MQINPSHIRNLDGRKVTSIAMGTYLGDVAASTDQKTIAAIEKAVESGLNFIDTAINYRCMHSEWAIGYALRKLIHEKKIKREDLFISTKGGFIPSDGSHDGDLRTVIEREYVGLGIISREEVVEDCHCISPNYLRDQIDKSLKNLDVEMIDLYYLHNPEIQLAHVSPAVFYERLERAFEALEGAVADKKIVRYGMATWTAFREEYGSKELVQLSKCVEIAQKAGGRQHHFKAIQLPYNLGLPEAAILENQEGNGQLLTPLKAAEKMGLSVLTSVPLLQGQLTRDLPPILEQVFKMRTDAQRALRFVVSTPGITAAMVGMKDLSHVEENLEVLQQEIVPQNELQALFRI